MERQTGKLVRELDQPALSEPARLIWGWFLELSAARGGSGFGPDPLSYPDIEAWSRLTGTILRPGEVRVLVLLDQAYLAAQAESE